MSSPFLARDYFETLLQDLLGRRQRSEFFYLTLAAECSDFIRFSQAKVRQIGNVTEADIGLQLVTESARGLLNASESFSLTGILGEDRDRLQKTLLRLRQESEFLPPDPFVEKPQPISSQNQDAHGELLGARDALEKILRPVKGRDFVGLYASGRIVRAMAHSEGLLHWFSTETFTLDYSLYTAQQRAVKNIYSDTRWDSLRYEKQLSDDLAQLSALEAPVREVPRGDYRTYLGPQAVADLLQMFSWGGVSEAALRQGESPLRKIRSGEKSFSSLFSLSEDFRFNDVPRFNEEGHISPEFLPLIEEGRLKNTLISSRSQREYGTPANGATEGEGMRSPLMKGGSLAEEKALEALGTGLQLSHLHYLNWSDQLEGRVTGMTRYACFWIENGKRVGPIQNMRFDDSIFRLFGNQLEQITPQPYAIADTMTYDHRSLGATRAPGILVSEMSFTL